MGSHSSSRLVALIVVCCACGEDTPAPTRPRAQPAAESGESEQVRYPAYPLFDDTVLRRAPEELDHVVPRLTDPTDIRFRNLVYEATNLDLRGVRSPEGLYADTGPIIAGRWREGAAGVRRVLALRDALFSQQDHPIGHDPVSVMMPTSWVTVAVHEVMEGHTLRPVHAPELDDDAAWAAFETPAALFGSFPPSERLHEEATKARTVLAPQRLTVTNARRSVTMLARQAARMVDASVDGPAAVAEAGADAIADSDLRYFGERLRREHIILVSVENPTTHERVDEGKGFLPPRGSLNDEAITMAVNAVFRRRLRDGDIGIERVDLNRMSERRHAVRLMERLIPSGDAGQSEIWLYVHAGPSAIEDALSHVYGFRMQLEAGDINLDRLRLMARPPVPIGGSELARKLWLASRRFRNHDLPMSLNIGTGLLGRLFEDLRPTLLRVRGESTMRTSSMRDDELVVGEPM